jgi:8-oxo-dGTP diphosphatase
MTDVTCALICNDENLILVVRRGSSMDNAGMWEFPGGKTRSGEDHEACIIREIDEELGMSIIITGRLDPAEYDYGDKQIRLIPFLCETLSSGPVLREHDEYRWMRPEELGTIDMTAADIPIARQFTEQYTSGKNEEHEKAEVITAMEAGEEMTRLLGRIFSVEEITMVAHSAVRDPLLLSQLITLSSSREKRVGFMASWALSKVSDIDPGVMVPFLAMMIDTLPEVPNESVQRSFLRVIMRSDVRNIPESHHTPIIEYCIGIMREANTPVAPKAYGMEILASFCDLYPDMVNEVTTVVQMALSDASGGIKAAARKIFARLSRKEKE